MAGWVGMLKIALVRNKTILTIINAIKVPEADGLEIYIKI